MASLSDVQNAMVNVIAPAMYPNGTSNPSIAGVPIYVAPGDFLKQDLDAGLNAGNIYIAVFAVNGMTRPTTRFQRLFVEPKINNPGLILTVEANTVIVTGTIVANEAAMVIVDGVGYSVKVLVGSTVNSIASALAALIPSASSLNNIVTISNTYDIVARVSVQGTSREILYSREGVFRARVITPSHDQRELVGDAMEIAFGLNGYYMPMPDGLSASIRPNRVMEVNPYELDNAFLRDYLFLVEYHTTYVGTFQTVADTSMTLTVGALPPT